MNIHPPLADWYYWVKPSEIKELFDALTSLLEHHNGACDHEYGDKYNCEHPESEQARAILAKLEKYTNEH